MYMYYVLYMYKYYLLARDREAHLSHVTCAELVVVAVHAFSAFAGSQFRFRFTSFPLRHSMKPGTHHLLVDTGI